MSSKASEITRRQIIGASLGLGLASVAGASFASSRGSLKLGEPNDRLRTTVKLLGSLATESVYTSFQGTLSGIIAGQTPVVICGYQGLARTDWRALEGGGFSKRSFDIGFFSDVETGRPLDKVVNPMTSELVEPLHFQYGGAAAKNFTLDDTQNHQWSQIGNQVYLTESGGGEFDHPMSLEKWPRETSGEKLFYRSETNYVSDVQQISNSAAHRANYSLFWSSLLSWEPWLLMGQTPGFNMWRGVGAKLNSLDDVPAEMQAYLSRVQPNYFDEGAPWPERIGSFDRFMTLRKPSQNTSK